MAAERFAQAVHAEAHGMWKLGVQQQKLGYALGPQLRGVDLAVGFKRGAASAAVRSIPYARPRWRLGAGPKELLEMRIDEARGVLHALDEAAGLDELPAFAVQHGGIGDAVEQMRALFDGVHQVERLRVKTFRRANAFDS